jgi:hypothetical protein
MGQSIIQETFMLLLISVDLMWGIAGQLSELSGVIIHRHGPYFRS